MELIAEDEVRPTDIIFGRGKTLYSRPANVKFRSLVSARYRRFKVSNPHGKSILYQEVKAAVTATNGRFLERAPGLALGFLEVDDPAKLDDKIKVAFNNVPKWPTRKTEARNQQGQVNNTNYGSNINSGKAQVSGNQTVGNDDDNCGNVRGIAATNECDEGNGSNATSRIVATKDSNEPGAVIDHNANITVMVGVASTHLSPDATDQDHDSDFSFQTAADDNNDNTSQEVFDTVHGAADSESEVMAAGSGDSHYYAARSTTITHAPSKDFNQQLASGCDGDDKNQVWYEANDKDSFCSFCTATENVPRLADDNDNTTSDQEHCNGYDSFRTGAQANNVNEVDDDDICGIQDNAENIDRSFDDGVEYVVDLDDDAVQHNVYNHDHFLSQLSEEELNALSKLLPNRASGIRRFHVNMLLAFVGSRPFYCENGLADMTAHCFEATIPNTENMLKLDWNSLIDGFPWGCLLGEGGYKRVFKVYNMKTRQYEAVAVMDDFQYLKESGELPKLAAEVAVSAMVSNLVRRGICPNFLEVKGMFISNYKPPVQWESDASEMPHNFTNTAPAIVPKKTKVDKIYIRSELCDEGDVSVFIRQFQYELGDLVAGIIPLQTATIIFFQIVVALHAGQVFFGLKHYDLKLENIFLQSVPTEKSCDWVVLRYVIAPTTFALQTRPKHALIAKLADFGSTNVHPSSMGCKVTQDHLGTEVNTPPEAMYFGDAAQQGHAIDAFSLGLCMFNLFVGHPYEAVLKSVTCPDGLKTFLNKVWADDCFSILYNLDAKPRNLLYDVFYRYMVMIQLPSEVPPRAKPVWEAIVQAVQLTCHDSYNLHTEEFSLQKGYNPYIRQLRCQLGDEGMKLLLSILSWFPEDRPSYKDILMSSFMAELREEPGVVYSDLSDVRSYTIRERTSP